jgi:hypothetical protein
MHLLEHVPKLAFVRQAFFSLLAFVGRALFCLVQQLPHPFNL